MKKAAQKPASNEIKIFRVYLIGQEDSIKIKALKWSIVQGEVKFEGAVDKSAQWTFFVQGVAAIKEEHMSSDKDETVSSE